MSTPQDGRQDDCDATNYAAAPPASTTDDATRYSDAPADPHLTAYTPTSGASGAAERLPRPFGAFELLEELGHGGMGVVYKARQLSPERFVALKVIRAGELATDKDVRLFRQEANEAARLEHPNIVPVYEVGEYDGRHYFTMRLVDGGSLERRLDHYRNDYRGAARLAATAARAVHHAHQRQVLHRDLKPGNILLDDLGRPHIADFGLAKRMGRAGEASQTGTVTGTPEYMAPEQARGDARLTTAADVYALGGVLYALLAGRPPFCGPNQFAIIEKVLSEEPTIPSRERPGVPRDLETVCLKCLHKEPSRRYGSAEAVAEDLERWLRGELVQGRPVGPLERVWWWCRRNSTLAGLYGLVVLTLVLSVIGGGAAWLWRRAETAREQAEGQRQSALKERGEKEVLLARSLYDAGQLALRQGGWQTCLDKIDLARKAGYPDSVELHLDRVQALFALHKLPEADQEIHNLSAQPDLGDLKGRVLLWNAMLTLNKSWRDEHALQQVKQALDLPLLPEESAYARGLLAKTSPEAVVHFQQSLHADPYFQPANSMLGLLLILLGRRQEARGLIQTGEAHFPEDPTFPLLYSFLDALEGRPGEAGEQLELAKAHLNPQQLENARVLIRLTGQAPYLTKSFTTDCNESLGTIFLRMSPLLIRLKIAESDPEAGLFLPIPPVLNESMKAMPREVGLTTFLFHKDELVRGLDPALNIHPEGMLFLVRGMFMAQRDDKEGWTKAEQDFRKASEVPSVITIGPRALYLAAFAEWNLDKEFGPQPEMRQRSLANIRKVLALGDLDAAQFNTLTIMARGMKDFELARWTVDEWARQTPDDPKLLEQEVGVEHDLGAYLREIALVDAILAKKPADAKRWQDMREKAVSLLQAQTHEAAGGSAK